jgi:nitroimidazol reductase NimA-like FMN-containing flavoprotein (pyridoxamine 5'-phosphate oxidase superfamily)
VNPFTCVDTRCVDMDKKEIEFLNKRDLCRLATVSRDLMPHVVPAVYAMDGERVIIAVDYGTRKLKNMKENPKVSLVVDDYDPNRAVFIQGTCEILERGKEYLRLLDILFKKFEFYRKHPWGEGESPILSITPLKVVSWGVL